MKKTLLAVIIILAFLISTVREMQFVGVTRANWYIPPANTIMTIVCPPNATYSENNVILYFIVETNLWLMYFYSIDGHERVKIDYPRVTSEVALTEYPNWIDGTPWYRRTLEGNITLSDLSEGCHSLILYQIYPTSPLAPQDGIIVASTATTFSVISSDNSELENNDSSEPTSPTPIFSLFTPNPSPNPIGFLSPSPTPTEEPVAPTLAPTFSLGPSPSPSSSPTPTTAEQPTATPSPIQTNQPLNNSSTSLPSEYALAITAVLIAISAVFVILALRNRKPKTITSHKGIK